MPLYKCTSCQHEWEGSKTMTICDWCDSPGIILEDETPLDKMIKNSDKLLDELKKIS